MDDWKQILLLLALVVVLLAIRHLGKSKGANTRSAILMKKYATISREQFDRIPQDELVDAVVSRVLAKAADSRRPDPVKTLSTMPHGSTVVYSVWAVCKEMAASDFAMLTTTATKELVEPAVEALSAIGAPRCAEALEAMRAAHAAGEDITAPQEAFRAAVTSECPLSLCEEYIIDHAADFIDGQEEETL